ncbi:hypothetical protein PV08_12062 [Exophiala spinifera]|uniref:Up-regulated during septation protein 1 domain-containing protein n=1 Tax=Exophiala spinifera TaxID=91928 RepID=A0A0D2AT36_9EURO|nr:uncharacterized protein PV08_12062 [Exophiala spinifera]KIW09675.1 hypothetical protein PV08_12062 [Exophiala spinifera]
MLTAIQGPEAYVRCVEQNLQTLSAAVDGCRNAVHLMHEELLSSTERNHQCHYMNMSLLQQRDELAKEVNHLRNNTSEDTSAELEIRQLNKMIDILQKRIFELERIRDDQYKVRNVLKATQVTQD